MPWVKPKLPQENLSFYYTCYTNEDPYKGSQLRLQEESLQYMRLLKH